MKPISDKPYTGDVQEFLETLTGDTIDRLFEAVDEMSKTLNHCSICDSLMPLPVGHPHCQSCESPLMIVQCHDCGQWFCETGCAQDHVHQDGQRGRFYKRLRPLRDTSEYDA